MSVVTTAPAPFDPQSSPGAWGNSAVPLGVVSEVSSGELSMAGPGAPGTDPWTSSMWVTVPGRVRSKSNYRKRRDSSWGEVSSYEEEVHTMLRAARPRGWPTPDDSVAGDQRPVIVVVLAARTGLDAGNLSKSILDAAEGALYVTDAQVRSVTDLVVPSRTDQGLFAAFAALPLDTDIAGVLVAQTALLTASAALLTPDRAPTSAP